MEVKLLKCAKGNGPPKVEKVLGVVGMANRTGTYIAFDGLGRANPAESDFRYYATIQGWTKLTGTDFKFTNSHDKANAVRDTSKLETLHASIRQRLASSKNMLVILSDDTRKRGSVLSWEIEKAVDWYELPLIIAYTGCNSVMAPRKLEGRWPSTLSERIKVGSASAIHIPFKRDAMLNAINRFTVNGEKIGSSLQFYSEAAHREWGYI